MQQGAKDVVLASFTGGANDNVKTKALCARLDHVACLWQAGFIQEKLLAAFVLADTFGQGHGFGGGRCLIKHRGIRQFHAGQVQHHLLIGYQRLQAALRNFRLIGGIGGIPARILQHITHDHRWCDRVMVTQADIGSTQVYLIGQRFKAGQRLLFTARWVQGQWLVQRNAFRNRCLDQGFQVGISQSLQHQLNGRRIRANVAANKRVIIVQCIQRRIYVHSHNPA